jgi:uracil-DNA glycosylase family 4
LLIIGEAPGDTELVIGKPFVGPAGKYLESQLKTVQSNYKTQVTIAYANTIACAPTNASTLNLRVPNNTELTNCYDRLEDFIVKYAKPKTILLLGSTAKKILSRLEKRFDCGIYHAVHPSSILRQGERGMLDQARLEAVIFEIFTVITGEKCRRN